MPSTINGKPVLCSKTFMIRGNENLYSDDGVMLDIKVKTGGMTDTIAITSRNSGGLDVLIDSLPVGGEGCGLADFDLGGRPTRLTIAAKRYPDYQNEGVYRVTFTAAHR